MTNVMKQLRAVRDARAKAALEGSPVPVAFWWDDPELLTVDGDIFEIHFNDMIDDWYGISSSMVVEALLTAGGKDVLVHVNSPGGMVFEGMSIHAAFSQYAGKVTMRVEGLAASAASFVMLAGNEVEVTETGTVMIHDAWDITIGPEAEHRKAADVLAKISNSIAGMYAGKAGGSAEDWRATMVKEEWYVGQAAVDAGLVDSVVTIADPDTAAAARWSGIFAKDRRAPAAHVQPASGECAHGGNADRCGVPGGHGNAPAIELPVTVPAEPKSNTAPDWWSVLQSGLEGLKR